jgi:hypothetical protein
MWERGASFERKGEVAKLVAAIQAVIAKRLPPVRHIYLQLERQPSALRKFDTAAIKNSKNLAVAGWV